MRPAELNPTLSASANTLNMTQKLPEGWKSGSDITTGRLYYISIHNNKAQWEFPTTTTYQKQIEDMQSTIQKQQEEIRDVRTRDLTIRNRQQKEIQELRGIVEQLQQQLASLITQSTTTTDSSAKASTVVPLSPSAKSEAKDPRQPSSYKPPQTRTCEKCSTMFPSGQALFRHLPDCQPFKCTKCGSTFPSNTTLHKHARGCRRPKDINGNSNTNKGKEKQED